MKRDNSRFRETVKICGVVLATAVAVSLAVPVMVGATGSFVTIQDDAANNNANAQVDGGKLRVGDGAGGLTVDGTVSSRTALEKNPWHFLAQTGASVPVKLFVTPPGVTKLAITSLTYTFNAGEGVSSVSVRQYSGTDCSGAWVTHHVANMTFPETFHASFPTPIVLNVEREQVGVLQRQ